MPIDFNQRINDFRKEEIALNPCLVTSNQLKAQIEKLHD